MPTMPMSPSRKKLLLQLRKGFDLLDDHVVVTDPDGRVLYANGAVERATGFTLPEILGRTPGELWGGHMSAAFYKEMWETIGRKKKPFKGEVNNVRKDGREVWQQLHISPVTDRRGKILFFIGIEPSVTAHYEEDEMRRQLLSVIGHESMSPLTAVKWLLELTGERARLNARQRTALTQAYAQQNRLDAMLRDLLQLTAGMKGYPLPAAWSPAKALPDIVASFRDMHPAFSVDCGIEGAVVIRTMPSVAEGCIRQLLGFAAARCPASGRKISVSMKGKGDAVMLRCLVPVTKKPADIPHTRLLGLLAKYLGWAGPTAIRATGKSGWSLTMKSL